MRTTCYVSSHFHKASWKSLKLFSSYRQGTHVWFGSLLTMFKGWKLQTQLSQSYSSCVLQIVSCWYTFASSFKKISRTVSCYRVDTNILQKSLSSKFKGTEWTQIYCRNHYFQSSKGHNSISRLTRVTVFVFCMFSHNALHLWEVSSKYLELFSTYRADTLVHGRNGYVQCSKANSSKSRQAWDGSCVLHVVS